LYRPDIFLNFEPVNHHFVAAAKTPQSKIRPRAKHKPLLAAAGMGFFHG
jgi:hypothetical protein